MFTSRRIEQVKVTVKLAIALVLFLVICRLLEPSVSKQEPVLMRARVPLFGHLFGMMRNGNAYFLIKSLINWVFDMSNHLPTRLMTFSISTILCPLPQ